MGILAAMSAILVLGASARPQPEAAGVEPPARAIAWVEFDPRGLGADPDDPISVLVKRGVAGLAFGVVAAESEAADAARRAWGALHDEPGPWRAALLEAGGSVSPRTSGGERSFRLDRVAAVVESEPGEARFADAERRARESVGAAARVQARDGRITIAVGDGALDRWLRERGGDEPRAWQGHRVQAAIAARTPARGLTVLQAWVDLNALRMGLPDAFERTALSRLLRAWRLTHARAVMVQVHLVPAADVQAEGGAPYSGPPLLAVELTWESRTEPPGTVHALSIARSSWPRDAGALGLAPGAGAYAAVAPARWDEWRGTVLGTFTACGSEWDELARSTRIGAWERRHGGAAARLIAAVEPWVRVCASSASDGGPRALVVRVPLREGADPARVAADLAEVSSSIDPGIEFDRARSCWTVSPGGVGVSWRLRNEGARAAIEASVVAAPPARNRPAPDPSRGDGLRR